MDFNNEIGSEDNSEKFEINFTNNKGFFLYLTKMLGLSSDFRLGGDNYMWLKTLDSLALATFPFWKDTNKKNEYELLYNSIKNSIDNMNKSNNVNMKKNILNCMEEELRKLNMIVSDNISHLMIRVSSADDDDRFLEEVFGK